MKGLGVTGPDRARAQRWLLRLFLAALPGIFGCGAMSTGAAQTGDDAGAPGGNSGSGGGSGTQTDAGGDGAGMGTGGALGGLGGASGIGGASGACLVLLEAVAPSSFDGTEAGPNAQFRVRASAIGPTLPRPAWVWTVKFGAEVIPTTAIDDPGATVDFPIANIGNYQIVAQVAGNIACRSMPKIAMATAPLPPAFTLRTTAAGFPVQDRRITLTNPQPLSIDLDPGVNVSIFPQAAQALNALASYVRISSPRSNLSIEGDTTLRPLSAWLLPDVSYDVLIIPLGDTAPDLVTGTEAEWRGALVLDPGARVTARMFASDGSAVAGARMILRRGARPSTVGISDGAGSMLLWTRGGTQSAFILPPATSGLPQATVGAGTGTDAGIVLDPGATSLDLQMTWNAVASSTLSLNVRGVDGSAAIAGARVRVRSQGSAAAVGTLLVQAPGGAPVTLHPSGVTEVEVVSDAAGIAVFSSLPVGTYDVTIVPPSTATAASPAAITTTTVTLGRGGLSRSVNLVAKVALTGMLLPVPASAGTRITAIDRSEIAGGTAVSTIVAADGHYTLMVDPVRSYQLVAEPAIGASLARAVVGTIVTETATTTVTPRTLPAGHPFTGQIRNGTSPVSGALVQIFCPSLSARCLDPAYPLAAALTRGDGTFDLLLPEPSDN